MTTETQKLKFLVDSATGKGSKISRKMIAKMSNISYSALSSKLNGFITVSLDDLFAVSQAVKQLQKKNRSN